MRQGTRAAMFGVTSALPWLIVPIATAGLMAQPVLAASGSGISGPYAQAAVLPAVVNAGALPEAQTGNVQQGNKVFRHPGGQAKLDQEKADSQNQGQGQGIQQPGPALANILAPSPGSLAGINGISDAESFCGCYPPDGGVAARPDYLVATVNNAANHQADTLYPARGVTAASTGYFIATDNCNGCNNVSAWRLTNPWGTPAFTLQGGVTVATYNQPPAAAQLGGGTIDSGDTRTLGGHMFNGTIYRTHTIGWHPGTGTGE